MMTEIELTVPHLFGLATYPPGASFGPRQLRDYEFVWIVEGDAEYRWADRVMAAPAGSLVLCRPGRDAFRWDPARRTRHGYFHFNLLRIPSAWPPPQAWPFVRPAAEGGVLLPLFRHLVLTGNRLDPLQCRLTVACLLAAFVSGDEAAADVPGEALPEPVERVLSFIHEKLEADASAALPLSLLADAACVSPEYLCRLFRAETGRGPVETVRLARLDRAATLLARSNYSVAEVAALCGFASPFHFSRRFKEACGQTPTAFRTAAAAGETPPTPLLLRHRRF